jgi:disulfide bond formation protein DsbB
LADFSLPNTRSETAVTIDKLAGQMMLVSSLLFTVAAGTIVTAHAFEILGGYLPCHLCLIERYAYYFGVLASVAAFFAARAAKIDIARLVFIVVAVAFLANTALGFYHSGIEWKWWEGPTECSGGSTIQWGEGGLAQSLETNKVIACDEAAWRFLGLSFAGWNAVLSLTLAGIAAYGATRKR